MNATNLSSRQLERNIASAKRQIALSREIVRRYNAIRQPARPRPQPVRTRTVRDLSEHRQHLFDAERTLRYLLRTRTS